ncbi:MAG: hypothetical protein RL020_984 [Pseudomonadota bacterium]|jgi:uncharacterized protein (DUF934 family)
MPKIIKDRAIVDDAWTLIRPAADGALPELPAQGDIIVPLAMWQAQREVLLVRKSKIGVWLAPNDEPEVIAADLDKFSVIAVDFPQFTDGRGYSIARLLRERYKYTGELRAIGDVLQDQIYYLQRCGFNAFAVRADKNIEDALNAFNDFSETYQTSVEQPQPLFRRR